MMFSTDSLFTGINIDQKTDLSTITETLRAIGTLDSPHMPDFHNLPDLVIDKTLQLLPTKPAFQVRFLSKNWQGVVGSCPSLNFNEGDDFNRHKNLKCYGHYQLQHIKFIKFLKGYLVYLEKYDQEKIVDKLSLHMSMYGRGDSPTITKWLRYASKRGLKELDISTCFDSKQYVTVTEYLLQSHGYLYRFPWVAIATATSLTTLKLECVRIPHAFVDHPSGSEEKLFASLKNLSFKTARFSNAQHLTTVLYQCPFIQYLSLTECSIGNHKLDVGSSSLKSLEVKFCKLDYIRVEHALNLESFTYFSLPYSKCEKMILNRAFNLKHIYICVHDYLREFSLLGCHPALEASIISQWIHRFEFFEGYLSSKVYVRANQAKILVGELLDQEWFHNFSAYVTHVPRLLSFLEGLKRCMEIDLYNQDVQALIIPKHYRLVLSPPLPHTWTLQAWMPNPPVAGSRDFFDLGDSLQWIAPSAKISIKPVDVEEARKEVHQLANPVAGDML